MSYNEKLPEWYAPGTEPPESKKTAGWDPGDKPPAGYFNWLFNKAYLALKELQSKAAEKTIFDGHASDLTKHPLYGVTAGTVNAYTVTFNPAPTAYTDGMAIALKIHANASAGSATINVNGLGAKSLKKANGLDATNLKKDGIYTFRYNTTTGNFILQGEGGAGNANPSDVLVGKTFSNDSGDQTGTMPDRSAVIITPSTANQTIANGYHNGAGYVKGDANLIPANILLGKSIFGVSGSVRQYPTKLRNVKVGNPIWTKTYSWTGPGNVESRIYIPDKFDAYIYMTSDSANKVLEKRAQSNGVIAWSSTL
ncbi:hypothetical protein P4V75_16455, partial [Brevibacillus reuszeri]|nr:hypothetical protein [Brevibacillus reuszeri]